MTSAHQYSSHVSPALKDAFVQTTCRVCDAPLPEVFVSLGVQPLANDLQQLGADPADQDRYPLEVSRCESCGLAQLTVTVNPDTLFRHYTYASSYSDAVLENAKQLVDRLVARRNLTNNDLAIEIASNDGYLLKNYVAQGVEVLGVDPARNIAEMATAIGVPTLAEFFGRDVANQLRDNGQLASVIHANNVIAHVPDLNGVFAGMATVLRPNGLVVIETPWIRHLVERVEFDTIYHEHIFYYSLHSISAALELAGLLVVDVEEIAIHGGTLRIFAMHANASDPKPSVHELLELERSLGMNDAEWYQTFGDRVIQAGEDLRKVLSELKAGGATIAAYGAAAKGAVLLNTFGIDATTIDFVADRSTLKHNQQMPGVGIPILPTEALVERQPDYTLLLAWNHAEEVMAQQSAYREAGGKFIIPVPSPVIV